MEVGPQGATVWLDTCHSVSLKQDAGGGPLEPVRGAVIHAVLQVHGI